MGKLRVGIAALRRTLRSHLAVAMEEGVEGVIIDKAAAALQRIPIRINASESIAQLSHWHETMKTAAQELEARLSTENTAPEEPTAAQNAAQAEISCTTYTETKNNYPINGTSTKFTEGQNKTKTHDSLPIGLIKQCLGDGIEQDRWPRTNNWHDIVNKMQERAIMLDIDQASWTQACSTLGRTSAAICAIILENRLSRQDASHVRNPRAYFNALIHRGLQDKLDMTASLRGIARRKSSRRVEENHSFHINLKQHHHQSVAMP
jgi:hypothetical protein